VALASARASGAVRGALLAAGSTLNMKIQAFEQRLTGQLRQLRRMLLEEQVSAEPPVEETTPND
jgi:hypothetical protein